MSDSLKLRAPVLEVVLHGGCMSDNPTRDDVKKMRESCLDKAAFYMTMVRACDWWLLIHDKLLGGIVTQKEDPGAGS